MVPAFVRLTAIPVVLLALPITALAQSGYSYPQLRLVRQIASATYLAELCGARMSREGISRALRSERLGEQDLQTDLLRDEMAKQKIALRDSYEALSMTIMGRQEALRRQCDGLERNYGPRGAVRPGLAISSAR